MEVNRNKCIYCFKQPPEIRFTDSHPVPYSFGGRIELRNTVCGVCNEGVGRSVEIPIIESMSVLRSLFLLESRKGYLPAFKSEIEIKGIKGEVKIDGRGNLRNKAVYLKDPKTKNIVFISKSGKDVDGFIKSYRKNNPTAKLEEFKFKKEEDLRIDIDFISLCSEEGLRLAAKIAFEIFCFKRDAETVLDSSFNEIRNYILAGGSNPKYPIVSIISDPNILKLVSNIPIGNHAVILMNSTDQSKIAIVYFFGLVLYKVILQRINPLVSFLQEALIINQLNRKGYEPLIISNSPKIKAFDNSHYEAPKDSFLRLGSYIKERMDSIFLKK